MNNTAKKIISSLFFILSPFVLLGASFTTNYDFSVPTDYVVSSTEDIIISGGSANLLEKIVDYPLTNASSIEEKDNFVYVAAENSIGVFDITDPLDIVFITKVENDATTNLGNVYDIHIDGDYLYTASRSPGAFSIFDISDPADPTVVSTIIDDAILGLADARDVYVDGDYAYVTARGDQAISVIDITDKTIPVVVTTYFDDAVTHFGRPEGAFKVGDYLFTGGSSPNEDRGLAVIDVSDPLNIFEVGFVLGGYQIYGMTLVSPNILVKGARSGVELFDITDPENPVLIRTVPNTSGAIGDVMMVNPTTLGAVMGIGNGGVNKVVLIDVTDPATAYVIDEAQDTDGTGGDATRFQSPSGFTYKDGNMFVVSNEDAIAVFDTGDPVLALTYLGHLEDFAGFEYTAGGPYVVPVSGVDYAAGESLLSFTGTVTGTTTGTVTYQLSSDGGANWNYFNGSEWATSTTDFTESNTLLEIATEIDSFNTQFLGGSGEFSWRAFLQSDGTQAVELDSVSVDFELVDADVAFNVANTSALESSSTPIYINISGAIVAGRSGVEVAITGGTADGADSSYASTTNISVPAGDYSTTTLQLLVPGSIIDEAIVELDETIIFSISEVTGDLQISTSSATHTYTILNDDIPVPVENKTGSGLSRYVCKDKLAINYRRYGKIDNNLCKYEEKKETSIDKIVAALLKEIEQSNTENNNQVICQQYLKESIFVGGNNNPAAVNDLIRFLNSNQGESLVEDGTYDQDDIDAVLRFQLKYRDSILDIWGLTEPTGNVYLSTRIKINSLNCNKQILCPLFTEYNSKTENSNSDEVRQAKILMTEIGFFNGAIDKIYDNQIRDAIALFQETFSQVMLEPWGLSSGTGYKYKTTNKFMNKLVGCSTDDIVLENGVRVQ